MAQHYSFSGAGMLRGELPTIEGELFGYYLVPDDQEGVWPISTRIRWVDAQGVVGEWKGFQPESHNEEMQISRLYHGDKEVTGFQLQLPQGVSATLHIYDPGQSASTTPPIRDTDALACDEPEMMDRSEWCPANNCPGGANPAATTPTHMIVHHSASSNNASDWAAVVRTIWDFHVNGNGWDDVGYNFLVDPNGVIYVGRGNNIRGAHFCGKNTGTLGNCVLGDFTSTIPTQAARDALAELLAWETSTRDIDPLGTSFHAAGGANLANIAGHRQGCSTSCPGDQFFPLFTNLRNAVNDLVSNCDPVGTNEPLWAANLEVFPNPSPDRVYLQGLPNGIVDYRLSNTHGQQIATGQLINGDFIDASLLPAAGLYFLELNSQEGRIVRKLVFEF